MLAALLLAGRPAAGTSNASRAERVEMARHIRASAATDAKSVTRRGVRTLGLGESERFSAIVVSLLKEAARRTLRSQMERRDLQEPGERINSAKEFRGGLIDCERNRKRALWSLNCATNRG